MLEYGFSVTCILLYKGKICDSVKTVKNRMLAYFIHCHQNMSFLLDSILSGKFSVV